MLLTMKKAQDISITTIIVAALALVVLIVLVLIFYGKIGKTSEGIDETTSTLNPKTKCVIPGVRKCAPSGNFEGACEPGKQQFDEFGGRFDCQGNEECCFTTDIVR